jgi:hypothetical protein
MLSELEPRVQELNTNQETFTTFLRGLNETQLNQPGASEEYSAKQTVAHLIGADTSMLRMAKNWIAQQDNRLRPDFDLNFFNQRQQEKRAAQSLDELLNDWDSAHRALIALLETVTAEDLEKRGDHPRATDTTLRNLFLIITTHEQEHIQQTFDGFGDELHRRNLEGLNDAHA